MNPAKIASKCVQNGLNYVKFHSIIINSRESGKIYLSKSINA